MTREEAIDVLNKSIKAGSKVTWLTIVEAVELAIQALSVSLPEGLDAAARNYRNYRESMGIKDPVMLDEIESAHYAGGVWMAEKMK